MAVSQGVLAVCKGFLGSLSGVAPASEDVRGNAVTIPWGWGGHSAYLDICEIQVDRGDGKGFVMLTFDTSPGYTDTAPFPASPTKWTYRAIYRVGDAQVGQRSKETSVMVGA